MRQHKTVPRQQVVDIAEQVRSLLALKASQAHTQAKLIRGCIAAIKRVPTSYEDATVRRKIINDRALAFLHLEWLATQLEDVR